MMTAEKLTQVKEWLYENQDKWENWGGFTWLIPNPEEVVPSEVLEYVKWQEENDKALQQENILLESMGLTDYTD